jgi:hypothetical protein
MDYPSFVGPSYQSQSATADQEDTINWYPERMESPGAVSKWALYPTPGVTELDEYTSGPGRAHFFLDGREFAVQGTAFNEISESGTITNRGTVAMGSNPATICGNGDGGGQLFITSGDNGYVYTLATDTLTQVAALNGIATMGDQLDGYFIALDANTSKVYASDLLDGATWTTGSSFAQRSGAPDPWKSIKVAGPYIWKFGEQTSEAWYDSASTPYPFSRTNTGTVPYGIAAPFSAAVADGQVIWLGATKNGQAMVLRASGLVPEVISTYPLQKAINSYGTISDATADVYNDLGHTFYLLHFPSEDVTWAYDTQTGVWCKRGTWISEDNTFVASRARWHAFAFGEHRTLDSSTGSVYRMSTDLTSDVDDRPIRRLRRAPALVSENQRIQYPGFEVLLESGLGTSTGQGANPRVMMRMSNDGGKTWSPEFLGNAGAIGEYWRRVRWNRLGMGRQRVFEISVSDPIPWRLANAFLRPEPVFEGGAQRRASA